MQDLLTQVMELFVEDLVLSYPSLRLAAMKFGIEVAEDLRFRDLIEVVVKQVGRERRIGDLLVFMKDKMDNLFVDKISQEMKSLMNQSLECGM